MHQQTTHSADHLHEEPPCTVAGLAQSAVAEVGIEPGDILSLPRVLARIPDVDAGESGLASEPLPTNPQRRLIGQGLSTKLLMCATFLLVLAAIIPWNLRKSADPASSEADTPAWHAPVVPAAADRVPSPGIQTVQTPKAAPSGVGGLRPSKAVPTAPAAVQLSGPSRAPAGNSPNPNRTGYEASRPHPGYYRQPIPEYRQQAPQYQQQAPEYRHQSVPEASSNRPMAIGEPAETPPNYRSAEPDGPVIDPRWGDMPRARTDAPSDRGAYQRPRQGDRYPAGSAAVSAATQRWGACADAIPLHRAVTGGQDARAPVGLADRRMPLPPAASQRTTSVSPAEPGAATFQGNIENPPIKTEHERARPGVF